MSKIDIQVIREFVNIDPPQNVAVDNGDASNIVIDTDCNQVTIDGTIQNVNISDPGTTTVVTQSQIETVEISSSGATTATNPNVISLIAGEALGGQRIVTTNASGSAVYADNTTLTDSNKILGFTRTSAGSGSAITILTLGEMVDASFSFTPDVPIWLGVTGLPTQTPPTGTNLIALCAQALTATKIFIRVQQSIIKI